MRHIVFVEASGTGAGVAACRIARERGCHVTLVTRNRSWYSAQFLRHVDEVLEVETNERAALSDSLRDFSQRRQIDGLTTTQDLYVPQAAWAAQVLGLPGLTYSAAAGVRNKYLMRLSLARACPDLNPRFRLAHTIEEALDVAREFGFPLIAKPQDSNDSFGVKLVHDEATLVDYMEMARSWASTNSCGQPVAEGVLLEDFMDGPEFCVDTMQSTGRSIQLIGVFQKVLAGADCFIKIGAAFPEESEVAGILFAAVSRALAALQVECGVLDTDVRLVDGRPKILEINPRLVGDQMGSHVIPLATGATPVEAVVAIALGEHPVWNPRYRRAAAIYRICAPRSGIFERIENVDELRAVRGVAWVNVFPLPGTAVNPATSNRDVIGSVITEAPTPGEALQLAKSVAARARVALRRIE